jgi:hypothetical protein
MAFAFAPDKQALSEKGCLAGIMVTKADDYKLISNFCSILLDIARRMPPWIFYYRTPISRDSRQRNTSGFL